MIGNTNTVDLEQPLEKRRREKTEQDDKTEKEQLLREIKKLNNYISASSTSASSISASSVHTAGKTDGILIDLSERGHEGVQINITNLITSFIRKMTPEEAQQERS